MISFSYNLYVHQLCMQGIIHHYKTSDFNRLCNISILAYLNLHDTGYEIIVSFGRWLRFNNAHTTGIMTSRIKGARLKIANAE